MTNSPRPRPASNTTAGFSPVSCAWSPRFESAGGTPSYGTPPPLVTAGRGRKRTCPLACTDVTRASLGARHDPAAWITAAIAFVAVVAPHGGFPGDGGDVARRRTE